MAIRVLHIIADGRFGGGPTVVQTLCEELRSQGVASTVITQKDSDFLAAARDCGITAIGLDFTRRTNTMRLRAEILDVCQAAQPTVIHAHGARSALPVALTRPGRRAPFVYTVHGFHYPRKSFLPRFAARQVETFCIDRAGHTIFVAQSDCLRDNI